MNDYRAYVENDYNSLYHFGIKGQRWGIRRYQNPDGSLTPEGKKRYLNPDGSLNERGRKELGRQYLKDRKYAGRVAGGALGTAAAAAFAKEYGWAKYTGMAEKEKNAFIKNANKNKVFVKEIGLEDYGGNKHRIPVNAIVKKGDYYDAYNKIKWYDDKKGRYVLDPRRYRTPNQMEGFKEMWARQIKPEDYVDDLKRIDAKAIGRRKALVAGVLAAGIGATAVGLYVHHKNVQKRKAEMEKLLMGSDNSDSSVTKRVKEDWNNLSDKDFKAKYGASKDKYAKRVAKYRDPYMNAPLAKLGKSLSKKKSSKNININRVLTARKVNEYNEMKKNTDFMKERNLEIAVNKNTGGLIYRSKNPSNRKVNSPDYVPIESEEDLMQILDRIKK